MNGIRVLIDADCIGSYKSNYHTIMTTMFSPGTPVSSTNKTDRNEITEILLKVALNTITKNKLHKILNIFILQKICNGSKLNNLVW
jgi:hypothetical protein